MTCSPCGARTAAYGPTDIWSIVENRITLCNMCVHELIILVSSSHCKITLDGDAHTLVGMCVRSYVVLNHSSVDVWLTTHRVGAVSTIIHFVH